MPAKLLVLLASFPLFAFARPVHAQAISVFALPEPGTVLLMGFGLAAIGLFHKQGRRIGKIIQRWIRTRQQRQR